MKVSQFVLIVLLSTSSFVYAQGLELGLRGGLNFDYSSLELVSDGGTFSEVTQSRTGYLFGGYAHIKLGLLSIQPEVYYSIQGSDITLDGATGAIKSNYLQIPLLVRLNFLKVLNVHLGPQYGLLLNSETEFGGVISDIKDQSKSGDFSVLAGFGVRLPANLSVNLRYAKGFTEMVDGVKDSGLRSLKNAMLQLTVGYALVGR